MTNGITRAFNRSGATRAVVLDIFKTFNRMWDAGFLYKLKSYRLSGQILDRVLSFLSNTQLQVFLDKKSSQQYPVNT